MNILCISTCVNWLTNTGPGLLQATASIPQYLHMVLSSPIGQYLAFAASQLTSGSVGSSGTTGSSGSSGSSGATGSWGSSGSGAGGPFKERVVLFGLLSRTLDVGLLSLRKHYLKCKSHESASVDWSHRSLL